MAEEFEYGVAANIDFPLIVFSSTNADFSTTAVLTNGDVKLSQDGSSFELLQSTGAAIGSLNSGIFTLALTSTEMQFARAVLKFTDTDATKIFEDQAILMVTYGSTDARHALNRNSTELTVNVTTITAGAITSTAFAAGAINSTSIASNAFLAVKFADGFISASKIAAGSLGSTNFVDGFLLASKFGVGFLTSTGIAAGAILSTGIAANALIAEKFATDALSTTNIAAGVFTKVWAESTRSLTTLPAGIITASVIAANAIGSTQIADSAILEQKIATAAITSTKIGAGAIGSTQIGTGAITAGKIATDALTTDEIADGVFTRIAADMNTEVLDVLTVDQFGEPITTTDAPPVSNSIVNKVGYLYGTYRNRIDASTELKTFYTSTGGIAFTKVISDTGTYIELAATT